MKPSCNAYRVPTVRYTETQHSSMRTLLSSAGVSWRTLMGFPSYARYCACALPSPSPFHYVMAKIVPVVLLAAHAKSSTLYGRSYGRTSKFFRLDGLQLLRATLRAPQALRAPQDPRFSTRRKIGDDPGRSLLSFPVPGPLKTSCQLRLNIIKHAKSFYHLNNIFSRCLYFHYPSGIVKIRQKF